MKTKSRIKERYWYINFYGTFLIMNFVFILSMFYSVKNGILWTIFNILNLEMVLLK